MSLTNIFGPMMSGKTTELIMRGKKASDAGLKVLYINTSKDNRTETMFSTHNTQIKEECVGITMVKVNKLSEVSVKEFDLILIDEAHFFVDLVPQVKKWLDNERKDIIVAALSGDIKRELIGTTHQLLPLITKESIILKSICKKCVSETCTRVDAPYTILISVIDDRLGQYKVGGLETYEAVCLSHYLKKQRELGESH